MLSPGVQLSAFALADDGTRYAGSRAGMLWAAPPDAGFAQRASTHVRCLGARGDTLYVCGDNQADGFALARSADHGQTLAPLLRFQDVQGLAGCGQVPQACADAWRSFAGTFGIALQPDGGAATGRAAGSGCGCGSDASPLWAAFAVLAWVRTRATRALKRK
jgi:hypothetical protein